MDELISRQAAIDGVKTLHEVAWKNWHEPTLSANVVIDMIKELPSAQPEKHTEERTETHACDCISRQAEIDTICEHGWRSCHPHRQNRSGFRAVRGYQRITDRCLYMHGVFTSHLQSMTK